jgi:flagellar biosynthesis/type III secretory pathway protein FliH
MPEAPDEQREAVMSVMAQEREQGRLEGYAEGQAEGRVKGKAETLLRLLDRHFHDVPEDYRRLVLTAEADQLDAWIDTVLDAETVEGVFVAPTAH